MRKKGRGRCGLRKTMRRAQVHSPTTGDIWCCSVDNGRCLFTTNSDAICLQERATHHTYTPLTRYGHPSTKCTPSLAKTTVHHTHECTLCNYGNTWQRNLAYACLHGPNLMYEYTNNLLLCKLFNNLVRCTIWAIYVAKNACSYALLM